MPQADESDLQALDAALAAHYSDPRLVAVGEIGLDFFIPELTTGPMRAKQEFFYSEQLKSTIVLFEINFFCKCTVYEPIHIYIFIFRSRDVIAALVFF